MAVFYAGIIIISHIGGFLGIQANAASKSINEIIGISPLLIGIVIAAVTGITIIGGVKKIATVSERLVVFATIFYVIICSYIIFTNTEMIIPIFREVINGALNFRAFGMGLVSTLIIGMQKGIFSSEVRTGGWSNSSCSS